MDPLSDGQIRAMVALLEDPDQRNADLVKRSLVGLGEEAIPSIVRAIGMVRTDYRDRLESILGEIRLGRLEDDFSRWSDSAEDPDLEEGAFLVARIGYPDLQVPFYRGKLDELARAIRPVLANLDDADSVIAAVNRHLYVREQFHGNVESYYDPDNSYLNRVLDRKTGIPITLSVVHLLVARRLNLPMTGIGLPGHFILKYETPDYITYLDPFHQGQVLTRADCMRFLTHSGYTADDNYLVAVTDRDIVVRMIRNLAFNYKQSGAERFVDLLRRMARAIGSTL